ESGSRGPAPWGRRRSGTGARSSCRDTAAAFTSTASGSCRGVDRLKPARSAADAPRDLRRAVLAFACALAALFLTGTAAGVVRYGVTEDAGKYAPDGGSAFYSQLNHVRLT